VSNHFFKCVEPIFLSIWSSGRSIILGTSWHLRRQGFISSLCWTCLALHFTWIGHWDPEL